MCDSEWIYGTIGMHNGDASIRHDCLVGNSFHDEVDIPSTERKFNSIWITFIFFTSDSESEIQETWIMCWWLVCWYARGEIKIHFTGNLAGIAGIGGKSKRIFFEKVGWWLERPLKRSTFTDTIERDKACTKDNTGERNAPYMYHALNYSVFLELESCF